MGYLGKTPVRTVCVPSSSSSRVYNVLVYGDGTTSCNCMAWINKKADKPRGCKHTRQVESAGNFSSTVEMGYLGKTHAVLAGKTPHLEPKPKVAPAVAAGKFEVVAPKRKLNWRD